jgi:hypothetical protein
MDITEKPVITILMSDWLWLYGARKQSFIRKNFGSQYHCVSMWNSYDTNVDASDARFGNLCLFSDAQAEKKMEIRKVKL